MGLSIDREKVIKGLENIHAVALDKEQLYVNHMSMKDFNELLADALELLEEQEAKPPIHVHEEYPEHDWETDEDGKIDEWAMSYEFHNGPMCKRCYHSFCIHCEPNGFNDGPCVIDEYKCPKCGCILQKGTKFCSECGQAVKWND